MNKLLITSAVAFALSISACSEQKTAEQLLASAYEYSQQGKFANAIIDYKNAVRLAPKNADARLGLGKAYLNQGNYISAEKELERAVQLGASFIQTTALLAQVKTRLNKFSEVEELVKASEDLNDNDYLIILTFAGMSALADGQVTKAQDYFSQAVAINKDAAFSQLANAYLLYSERDFAKGLERINVLVAKDENFVEASLLQGYLYFASKDFSQASVAFASYLTAYPLDHNIKFFQVNTLIKAQKFEQASSLNDRLLKIFKNSPLALQYKAQIEYHNGNYMAAREYASQAAGQDDSFVIAKMIAGVSSYQLDELEQAYDYLISLESMLPAVHPINVILLSIKIKLGHTDDLALSVAKLKALKNSDVDSDLLQITSLELMRAGDFTNAQTLLNKAVQVSPSSAGIKVQRGALLLSQGDLSGIKSLEQALSIDPSLHDTEFALARQYLRGNEVTKAQAIADKWLVSEQYQVSGNILNGLIAMQLEKVNDAEAYFKKVIALEKNNISALYNLALLSAYKTETEKAIAGFQKVIELNPNHHNAIRRYSVLQASQGKAAEAISFLSALHDQSKINGSIHKNLVIGLAQNLRISDQGSAAIAVLESIGNEQNLPARYWSVLADSYKFNLQFSKELAMYPKALKEHPGSYLLRIGYIGVLDKLKKYPQALLLTKEADKDYPNDEDLMSLLAYLDLANGNVQAAKKQLDILKRQNISNILVLDTSARIAMQEKKYQHAIDLYREIHLKVPNGNNVINLARALQFSAQGQQAEISLETHLRKEISDNRVRMLLAELYSVNNVNEDNSDKIISTYQAAIQIQPNNVAALNNLAWQQYQIGALNDAQQNIEQAIALAPNNIALQESYGVILVANKQFEKSIKVLSAALEMGSDDVNAQVSLAEAYIAIKQPEKAKKVLAGLSAHDSKLNIKIARLKQLVE